ncbi:MAG: hypothetical protein K2X50_01285 [Gammaproteobacteria bacterium]|nr:hypothetical protein [Gammaproteobacteria bacterium]
MEEATESELSESNGDDKDQLSITEYTKESESQDLIRLDKIIFLIQEVKSLDSTDKTQLLQIITSLFQISWLCAELPRKFKFNSQSEFKKIEDRNWIMLDFLSISLKEVLIDRSMECQWNSTDYSEILQDLLLLQSNLEKIKSDKNCENIHKDLRGLNRVIGSRLDRYCFKLSVNAIDAMKVILDKPSDEIYAVLRVFAIIGESCKLFSPSMRQSIKSLGFPGDVGILKILGDLRDLIIHDKNHTFQLLQSNVDLREKLCAIVLPFLQLMFNELNNQTVKILDQAQAQAFIDVLTSFSGYLQPFSTGSKACISASIDLVRIPLQLQLLKWAIPQIDRFNKKEDFVDWVIANKISSQIPGINLIGDSEIRDFYQLSKERLVSFHVVKKVTHFIQNAKPDKSTQKDRKKQLEVFFFKQQVTKEEKDLALKVIDKLTLVPDRLRVILKNFVKGKYIVQKLEDKYDERKQIILEKLKLSGCGARENYRQYLDFLKGSNEIKSAYKRNNDSTSIDHKLFLDCFPKFAESLIMDIITDSSDLSSNDLLLLMVLTENKEILEQGLNEEEYHAEAFHFMSKNGVLLDKMADTYGELKKLSLLHGIAITETKSDLARRMSDYVNLVPPIQFVKSEVKFVISQLDKLSFTEPQISAENISTLVSMLSKKHIKDNIILDELSKNLVLCSKQSCLEQIGKAFIKEKVCNILVDSIPLEEKDKKAGHLFCDLMNQVFSQQGIPAQDRFGKELSVLIQSENERSYDRIIESLSKKCNDLAVAFSSYLKEENSLKKAKLKLVAEYLVVDIGDESEILAGHTNFFDTKYYEISKRNLFIIALIRKCIAHYPLSVNTSWFEYLIELFSIEVPERLNKYLKLTDSDLWKRIYHQSRKVDISEFRETPSMQLEFQMIVEQCGYNPNVKIVNTPVGVMGDLTVLVESNITNTATLWDLFELELKLCHLLNAEVKVETAKSFRERAEHRVMLEDFQVLEKVNSLVELIMMDTVNSLIQTNDFSSLGSIGKSDIAWVSTVFQLLSMLRSDRNITLNDMLVIMSDKQLLRDSIYHFFRASKESKKWSIISRWANNFVDYMLDPLQLGHKPVAVIMRSDVFRPIRFDCDDRNANYVGQSRESLENAHDKSRRFPRLNSYDIVHKLKSSKIDDNIVLEIIEEISCCIYLLAPKIHSLVLSIQSVEFVQTVDRVRDQSYLNEYHEAIRNYRAERLRSRNDICTILRERATHMAVEIKRIIMITEEEIGGDYEWELIKNTLLLYLRNNEYLDAYFKQHEYKLTERYQSMDEDQRRVYGVVISKPELFNVNDLEKQLHVTSKFSFRMIARCFPRDFDFASEVVHGLESEMSEIRTKIRKYRELYAHFCRLRAIFINCCSVTSLEELFSVEDKGDLIIDALEKYLREKYCDASELPLRMIDEKEIFFGELYDVIEEEASNRAKELIDNTLRLLRTSNIDFVIKIFQEDFSVFPLLRIMPKSVNYCTILEAPKLNCKILALSADFDEEISQLHVMIARQRIPIRDLQAQQKVELLEFLEENYNCSHEYIVRGHSTMTHLERKTSSIIDLLKRFDWPDERIKEYQRHPVYQEHEQLIREYYEYRRIYYIVQSFQERAVFYSNKIRLLSEWINNQKQLLSNASINTKLFRLNERLEGYFDGYRINRGQTNLYILQLLETDYIKRRILKFVQTPAIIQPIVAVLLSCISDRNSLMESKLRELLLSVHIQVCRELRQETNFSAEEEQKFESWLESWQNSVESLHSPSTEGYNRHGLLGYIQRSSSSDDDTKSDQLVYH